MRANPRKQLIRVETFRRIPTPDYWWGSIRDRGGGGGKPQESRAQWQREMADVTNGNWKRPLSSLERIPPMARRGSLNGQHRGSETGPPLRAGASGLVCERGAAGRSRWSRDDGLVVSRYR
jgi:hypothetical protein